MTKKRKPSMRKKISWRKNISTAEYDGFLEKKLESERVGEVAKLKNADLFCVDVQKRVLSKQERKEMMRAKEPRCFEALTNRSSVPDPISKRNVGKLGVRSGKVAKKSVLGGKKSKTSIPRNANTQKLMSSNNDSEKSPSENENSENSSTEIKNPQNLLKQTENLLAVSRPTIILRSSNPPAALNPPQKVPRLSRSMPKKRNTSARFSELAREVAKKPTLAEETKFDVWNEERVAGEETWMSNDTRRHTYGPIRRKMPPSLRQRSSELPAIEEPHPGASYNPSYEDHQNLLRTVAEKELEERKKEEHLNRVTSKMFRKVSPREQENDMLRELSEGLPLENLKTFRAQKPVAKPKPATAKSSKTRKSSRTSSQTEEPEEVTNSAEEPQEESSSSEKETEGGKALAKKKVDRSDMKTRQQRRREKEAREVKRTRLEERATRRRVAEVYRVRRLQEQLKGEERGLAARRERRIKAKALKATEPKVLSKTKYEAVDPEFQLSEELAGSLRASGPAGNLLRDRFKSLQRRNIVAPSTVQLKITKAKVKRYIKPEHKIDLRQLNAK